MATRSEHRDRILRWVDATGGQRWTSDAGTGEVDIRMGIAFDREWKRILNANSTYRLNKRTPVSDSNGYYAVSDLSDLSVADAKKRLYRVIAVAIDDVVYEQQDFNENILSTTHLSHTRVWWFEGDKIMALPQTANKTANGIWVNYLPTRPEQLSADGIAVDFPDGYEDILDLEAASLLLFKGGAETGAAAELKALAEDMRGDMMADIARRSTKPMKMKYPDIAAEWGG